MKIYTGKGDDGTTGLLYGGRIAKTSPVMAATGAVDEAQAGLGLARAEAQPGSELDVLLVSLERDLYVVMAELSTAPANHHKLVGGTTSVTPTMVVALEERIDQLTGRFPPLRDFVIPGHDRVSALLDLSRTMVRRAERSVVALATEDPSGSTSQVGTYLNRLSDLLWTMARWQEQGESLLSRQARPRPAGTEPARTEPARTEPAGTEPAGTEPFTQDREPR